MFKVYLQHLVFMAHLHKEMCTRCILLDYRQIVYKIRSICEIMMDCAKFHMLLLLSMITRDIKSLPMHEIVCTVWAYLNCTYIVLVVVFILVDELAREFCVINY